MNSPGQPTHLHRLQQLAVSGLSGLGHQAFLNLTALPLPEELSFDATSRLLILRLIVQRQDFQLREAATTIEILNRLLPNLQIDDAFMFACEATRVNLMLRQDSDAIHHLLRAQALWPDADPDLQDYWHVVRSIMYTYLWDDQNRLLACQMARRSPPRHHPYHLNTNASVQRGNLVWAMFMTGDPADALPLALEVLSEIQQQYSGSATLQQFEVNVLRLRILAGQPPDQTELQRVTELIQSSHKKQLLSILYATQALAAQQLGQMDEAHAAYQRAFDNIENTIDESRSTLHTYDQALAFYRQYSDQAGLIRVLEGRMRIMESMRRRVTSIFSHLHAQTANLYQARRELALSRAEMIDRLSAIGERRDDATGKHTRRVADLVLRMARTLNLPDASDIAEAARLHDLGKVSLPDHILLKSGPLTPQERQHMQQHTLIGADMLTGGYSHILKLAQVIARSHHERWDGLGYPDGLQGTEIPLPARLVAVADVYDALLSERPYKPAWTPDEARQEIRRLSGTQFDPSIVTVLERVLNEDHPPLPQPRNGTHPPGT